MIDKGEQFSLTGAEFFRFMVEGFGHFALQGKADKQQHGKKEQKTSQKAQGKGKHSFFRSSFRQIILLQ